MHMRRTARQHETIRSEAGVRSEDYADFKMRERVMTCDGYAGRITAIHDGPYPGNEAYEVVLDGGMGGGLYTSAQLRKAADEAYTATQDYPELAAILSERPDPAKHVITATTQNGHKIDDHGEAPHTVRAKNPNDYDDESTEGDPDPKMSEPLSKRDEVGAHGGELMKGPGGVHYEGAMSPAEQQHVKDVEDARQDAVDQHVMPKQRQRDRTTAEDVMRREDPQYADSLHVGVSWNDPEEGLDHLRDHDWGGVDYGHGESGEWTDPEHGRDYDQGGHCYVQHKGPCDYEDEPPRKTAMPSKVHPEPEGFSHVTERSPWTGSEEPTHHLIGALNGQQVGKITFSKSDDGKAVHVHKMHVNEEGRGKGVASAMMDRLYSEHPDAWIDHGSRTHQGLKWWAQYNDPAPERNTQLHKPREGWGEYFHPRSVSRDMAENYMGDHEHNPLVPMEYQDEGYEEPEQDDDGSSKFNRGEQWKGYKREGMHATASSEDVTGCLVKHEGECPPIGDMHHQAMPSRDPEREPVRGFTHKIEPNPMPDEYEKDFNLPSQNASTHVLHGYLNGDHVGDLHFSRSDDGNAVKVNMLHTSEGRGKGVATAMTDALYDEHPGSYINHGARTASGIRWAKGYESPDPDQDVHQVHPEDGPHGGWMQYFNPHKVAHDMWENHGADEDPYDDRHPQPHFNPADYDNTGHDKAGSKWSAHEERQQALGLKPESFTSPVDLGYRSRNAKLAEHHQFPEAPDDEGDDLADVVTPGNQENWYERVPTTMGYSAPAGPGGAPAKDPEHAVRWSYPYPESKHQQFSTSSITDPYELVAEAAADHDLGFQLTAAWADVRAKAKRIRSEGKVRITAATGGLVIGEVAGDTHTYEAGLQRRPGQRQSVANWSCGCKWGSYHWGAPDDFSRFAGRMCSHALALQYEAQSQGMFGKEVNVHTVKPDWVPSNVVVKYDIDDRENVMGRSSSIERPIDTFQSWAALQGDSAEIIALLVQAAANNPFGERMVEVPPKPYGATQPHDKGENPASAGLLAQPDPDSWGNLDIGSGFPMAAALDEALFEPTLANTQDMFEDENSPADPQGLEATLHDEPEAALPETDGNLEDADIEPDDQSIQPMGSVSIQEALAISARILHEAEAERTALAEREANQVGGDDDALDEVSANPSEDPEDVVSRFQATTAAAALMGSAPAASGSYSDGDIAAMAKQALKSFSPAEQAALINEGIGERASNLDRLDIKGTHYAELDEEDEPWL